MFGNVRGNWSEFFCAERDVGGGVCMVEGLGGMLEPFRKSPF